MNKTNLIHNAMREQLELLRSKNPLYLNSYPDDFEKYDKNAIRRRSSGLALWAVRQSGTHWIDLVGSEIEYGSEARKYVECISGMGYEDCPPAWFLVDINRNICVATREEAALKHATESDAKSLGPRAVLQPNYSLLGGTPLPGNCQLLS